MNKTNPLTYSEFTENESLVRYVEGAFFDSRLAYDAYLADFNGWHKAAANWEGRGEQVSPILALYFSEGPWWVEASRVSSPDDLCDLCGTSASEAFYLEEAFRSADMLCNLNGEPISEWSDWDDALIIGTEEQVLEIIGKVHKTD